MIVKALFRLGVVTVTFVVAFFITTAFLDLVDQKTGYYNQGRLESNERNK